MGDRGGQGERGVGLKEAGSTDKGLFGLGNLSAAFWGWVKKVGWGSPSPSEQPTTLPDLGGTGSWRRCRLREPWKRGGWFCGG